MDSITSPSVFLTLGLFLVACCGEYFKMGTVLNAMVGSYVPMNVLQILCLIFGMGLVLDAVYRSSQAK